MVTESFPLQRIFTTIGGTVLLYALWYQISRQLVAVTFPGWKGLTESHKRDFIGRVISITQGLTSIYMGYYNLTDPILLADKVSAVTDDMHLASCLFSGYVIYDVFFVLLNWENEKHAGGPLTLVHHFVVLSMFPVGLYFNTAGWMGSGVLLFWGEITGPNQNLIWLLRTVVGTNHILYILNGLTFALSFLVVRTVILGYYIYLFYLHVVDDKHREVCMTPFTACNFAVIEIVLLYTVGLLWTYPVVTKCWKGIQGIRTGAATKQE